MTTKLFITNESMHKVIFGDYSRFPRYDNEINFIQVFEKHQDISTIILLNGFFDINKIFECACFFGNLKVAKMILNIFPNVEMHDSILLTCINTGNLEVIKWIFKETNWLFELHQKCINYYTLAIDEYTKSEYGKWMLNELKINFFDFYRRIFNYTCKAGNLEIAKFLYEFNSDIDFSNNLSNYYLQIKRSLLRLKPNIQFYHGQDLDYEEALDNALFFENINVAEWLLEINPDIDISNKMLIHQINRYNLESVEWILKKKPDINFDNSTNFNWFHSLCEIDIYNYHVFQIEIAGLLQDFFPDIFGVEINDNGNILSYRIYESTFYTYESSEEEDENWIEEERAQSLRDYRYFSNKN